MISSAALLAALAAPAAAHACTTFAMGAGDHLLVGKSYDWDTPHGLVLVNKRGVSKQALVLAPKVKPARWTSKYGSVSFNQYGREMPNGGINEAGLVVEIMWLHGTNFGVLGPNRPTVNELQWIQYQLDLSATVAQAVKAARGLQVARIYADVHYLICDKKGACAAFEYLGGKLVIHQGKSLPARALTNSTYADSAVALRQHKGFGGERAIPGGRGSLARFVRAASMARQGGERPPVKAAFKILKSVQAGDYTKWQIVYENAAGRVHFRMPGGETRTVKLSKLDFSCKAPVRVMDLHGSVLGDEKGMATYKRADNLKLIKLSMANLALKLPDIILNQFAMYPELATSCSINK